MLGKRKTFKEWATEHKTEIIVTGVGIVTVVTGIILYKNRNLVVRVSTDAMNNLADILTMMPVSAQNITEVSAQPVQVAEVVVKEITEVIPEAETIAITRAPHYTHKHIRNLSPGRKPSPDKVARAFENGFHLLDNQTWVEDYYTGGVVA